MRDPELCSPAEWAEHLRVMAAACDVNDAAWCIQPADCRELADRMDDLSEALRLLREARPHFPLSPPEFTASPWRDCRDALLAKYQED